MKDFARELRRNSTDAERILWRQLRDRQLLGCKFRRQYTLGPYIVDFVCLEARLIVEVDGGQHMDRAQQDVLRSQYLIGLGYKVLRFWNNEVLTDMEGVLQQIYMELEGRVPSKDSSGSRA